MLLLPLVRPFHSMVSNADKENDRLTMHRGRSLGCFLLENMKNKVFSCFFAPKNGIILVVCTMHYEGVNITNT